MADEPSVMEEALAEAQKLQNQEKMGENNSSENEYKSSVHKTEI